MKKSSVGNCAACKKPIYEGDRSYNLTGCIAGDEVLKMNGDEYTVRICDECFCKLEFDIDEKRRQEILDINKGAAFLKREKDVI